METLHRRTLPQTQPPSPVVQYCVPFDFSDGNLLIIAQDTQWLVHASVLTRASPVLGTIWAKRPSETVQVTSIRFDNLRYQDLGLWTNRLYENTGIFYYDEPWRVSELKSLLDTTSTLEHQLLYDAIVKCTLRSLPDDFDDWDDSLSRPLVHDVDANGGEFALIAILKQHRMDTGLPALFYRICSKYPVINISQGQVVTEKSSFYMSLQDSFRCLVGRERLSSESLSVWYWAQPMAYKFNCATSKKCTAARSFILSQVCREPSPSSAGYKIFALTPWDKEWNHRLCSTCGGIDRARHRLGRQDIWNKLPSYWGFEDWQALSDAENQPRNVPTVEYSFV
ncbi:hypothetical protein H0H92_014579 [Tricholoma furcatifolium]|nr:hypothetical protein H0H92_014579 [Tricholoma furcatifolium]